MRDEAAAGSETRDVVFEAERVKHRTLIGEVNRLKREQGAVILAHNYQTPEIFHGVADIRGDSLALARQAAETDAEIIVVCGVRFMAETAKIVNPTRTVLLPAAEAGCSLADAVTAADVRELKRRYPGVPVVAYVNTSAEVKAETDICCTSANAVNVVQSLGVDRVIFLPDKHLGAWVAKNTDVEVIQWEGSCEVHEMFSSERVAALRGELPGVVVVAHPECPLDVLENADVVGSTSDMIRFLTASRPERVALVTESSMTDNVRVEFPDVEFVRPDAECPHMKKITLADVAAALREHRYEVEVEPEIARRAVRAVERMMEVGRVNRV